MIDTHNLPRAFAMYAMLMALLALSGCAPTKRLIGNPAAEAPGAGALAATADSARRSAPLISPTPAVPPPDRMETLRPDRQPLRDGDAQADIMLNFEQVPLGTFIQAVYGTILKLNVQTDQKVMDRRDLVTLRTGNPQTPAQVESAARLLLKSYGIAVVEVPGLVRILPDNAALGYLPEIRRGRALPETPLPQRPIFQLVELQAVRQTEVAGWIKNMFGDRVKLQEDPARNAVLLSGQADNLVAALEAIQVLDQPLMRGRQSVRITPAFWSADELAKRLTEVLQAEGYSLGGAAGGAIALLPITQVNTIVVFAGSQAILNHVIEWTKALDRPIERGSAQGLYSYQVQNTDAEHLARTLSQILVGGAASAARPAAAASGQAAAGSSAPAAATPRVVVDKGTNTLIFQGGSNDYTQIRALLQSLDKPAKEALIEVTVAEVQLSDNLQFGVEWLLKEAKVDGSSIVGGTLGGLSIGSAGLTLKRLDSAGDVRAVVNALASDNRATILSTPRVVARNGETATIQVGQEVPIITSQQTATATTPTGSILQTVQYKNTGVILTVKPVIHSGDQVDLEIKQEVSSAQATTTGVSNSPTFGTRRIDTRLSLRNGATVLLGGLISSNNSVGNAGIPLLKDIPVLGHLFSTDTRKNDRTELIILITPHVVSNDTDAQAITDAFRDKLGAWVDSAVPPAPLPPRNIASPPESTAAPEVAPVLPAGQIVPPPAGAAGPASEALKKRNEAAQIEEFKKQIEAMLPGKQKTEAEGR